jgi:hypothetical protein
MARYCCYFIVFEILCSSVLLTTILPGLHLMSTNQVLFTSFRSSATMKGSLTERLLRRHSFGFALLCCLTVVLSALELPSDFKAAVALPYGYPHSGRSCC